MNRHAFGLSVAAMLALSTSLGAQDLKSGMTKGAPDLRLAGPIAFAPEGILLIGDPLVGAVFAVDTGDLSGRPEEIKMELPALDQKIASLLGTTPADVMINHMAVNPSSGNVYLSVSRGRGPQATPVILVVDGAGKISELSLKSIAFTKTLLPNLPAPGEGKNNQRTESITDIAYAEGNVIVAGLSNEEFASTLRSIPFPFKDAQSGTGVEIYHGSHGRFETKSPIRTFAIYRTGADAQVLAAYTCTPLVRFPLNELKPGSRLKGTTVAELGNGNRPLDMIVYQRDGRDYALLANNKRGVMKIALENVEAAPGITEKISDRAGQPYETIASLKGVMDLGRLNRDHAVIILRTESGALNLETIALP